MDYVKGTDLFALFTKHVSKNLLIPIPLIAFIISRIATALAYAHTYIVHRDISPENILISEQGVCKLTDFGISVVANKQPNYWAGKLSYMSPEQLKNKKIDERADIYSLGVVAFQMLTGIPLLFASSKLSFEEQVSIIEKQMDSSVVLPHLIRNDIPVILSRIVAKMLSPIPEYRYQRASAVANDLEKEYLYAHGFGPSNSSLSAYIDLFQSNFLEYSEEDIDQLSFLKDDRSILQLRRPLKLEDFSKIGERMLEERKECVYLSQLQKFHRVPFISIEPTRKALLKIKYINNVIEVFELSNKTVRIGRGLKNNIILQEKTISKNHAVVYPAQMGYYVEDMNSKYGTYLNGYKIHKFLLKEGDKIQIGSYLIYFLWEQKKTQNPPNFLLENFSCTKYTILENFTVEFYPKEKNLEKISSITDIFLENTPLGNMKKSIIGQAINESLSFFYSNCEEDTRITFLYFKSSKYMYVKFQIPEVDSRYERFLYFIQNRNIEIEQKNFTLNVDQLAISLILKVFDRIEIFHTTKEIELRIFF
jgi:serine/threonine protein kinase